MKVGLVLQARTGSTRLPAKVLRDLDGHAFVETIWRRLERARRLDVLVTATTVEPGDDELAALVRHPWELHRGSEDDVLGRYAECVERFDLDHIVRATADNPLVDPDELDALVDFHIEGGHGYSTNRWNDGSGLPEGVGVEIFTRNALLTAHREGDAPHHREHVNEHVLENPWLYGIGLLEAPDEKRGQTLQLTVDHEEQLRWMQDLSAALGPIADLTTVEVIEAVRSGRVPNTPDPTDCVGSAEA